MRPWVIWMINHKLSFILKTMVVLSYPIWLVVGYWEDAASDISYTLRNIDSYKKESK